MPVSETEYNFSADSSFALPHGKIWEERKRMFDSCIPTLYPPNAVLMRSDSFHIGSIFNMNTMKVVKNINPQTLFQNLSAYQFQFTSSPCRLRKTINIPLDSFMSHKFAVIIDTADNKLNNQINEIIQTAVHTEIEAGQWLTLDITNGFGALLDTASNADLIEYKKALLTPGNMILARSTSIADLSFYFTTKNPLPAALKNKLITKPIVLQQPFIKADFAYISDNSFQVIIYGTFQVFGQFMKCGLQ